MPKTSTSNTPKLSVRFKRGGRIKESHGGYSLISKGVLPERRKHLLSYLISARETICEDYGGEDRMSASQIILLDRAVSKLGCLRLMEEFARESGIMSDGELIPCLRKSYLAFSNSLRRDLEALKDLGMDQVGPVTSIQEIVAEIDSKKTEEEARKTANSDSER
jgi:hypothetical protein